MSRLSVFSKIAYSKRDTVFIYMFVSATLLALLSFYTCRIADDLVYAEPYGGYIYRDEPFPGFSPAWDFIKYHWENINGRSGDKLMALFLALPDFVIAIIQFATALLIFVFLSKLSFGRSWSERYGSILVCSLFILLLPWYDTGTLKCMFVNYHIGTAIILIWLWYFINPPKYNIRNLLAITLLSLLAGSWHEQFSLFFIPAIIVSLILKKDKSYLRYVSAFAVIAGLVFTITAPGFWVRLHKEIPDLGITGFNVGDYTGINLIIFLANSCCCTTLLLVYVWLLVRLAVSKRGKDYFTENQWIFLTFTISLILGSLYLNYKLNNAFYRIWWLPTTLSIVCWTYILTKIKLNKVVKYTLIWLVSLSAIVNLSVSLYWQRQIKVEFDEVIEKFKRSEDGVVYIDSRAPFPVSLLTLRKTPPNPYITYFVNNTSCIRKDKKLIKILPTELKDIETLKLQRIEGAPGYYRTPGGHILHSDINIKEPRPSYFSFISSEGQRYDVPALTFPLKAQRDSTLTYIWPHLHMYESIEDIALPLNNVPDF